MVNILAGTKNNFTDLNHYQVNQEAVKLIPRAIASKHNVIPLTLENGTLVVAMADTNNVVALSEVSAVCRMRVVPVTADPSQIRQAIDYSYKSFGEVEHELRKVESLPEPENHIEDISDAPVVRALDLIMNEAIKSRASDIHIEPQIDRVRIRYRIDGVLHEAMSLPLSTQAFLISRIKIMAKMNIADHRPQDGQLTFKLKNKEIDMRVATINTIYGEMGSLRILDKSFAARSLPDLGYSENTLEQYQKILKAPLGLILVCGPTGSGKTTTLYASLNGLDRKGRKVISIEDPVEYRFPDIDQVQVNPKANITFAGGVRSFMRHDPDVIMIGEIRDSDTAAMATQVALTGQLVLSSIHANDAAGSVLRLLDLGIGPFLISATLVCVIAQRMARRVCPHCRQLTKAPSEAIEAYVSEMREEKAEFFFGSGCNACSRTGYLGRIAISEIMVINQALRNAILGGASADEIRAAARKSGMITMWRDGMTKAKAGITTPSEVLRNILYTGL